MKSLIKILSQILTLFFKVSLFVLLISYSLFIIYIFSGSGHHPDPGMALIGFCLAGLPWVALLGNLD